MTMIWEEGKKERRGDFVFFQSPTDSAPAIILHYVEPLLSGSTFQLGTKRRLGTNVYHTKNINAHSVCHTNPFWWRAQTFMLHHCWLSIWTFQTGIVDGLEYLPGLEAKLEQVCGEVSRDVRGAGEAAPPICRLIANNGGSQTGTKWKKIVLVSRENFVFPQFVGK